MEHGDFHLYRDPGGQTWSKDQPATHTAMCDAHSLGTTFCSKFISVSDTFTVSYSAAFYKTPGVKDTVEV